MGKAEIVNFAVNVLGCGCHNSVFDSIDETENFTLKCGVRLRKKIVIGKRLLIFIADTSEAKPEDIGGMVEEGISERDSNGYNRLRLAIVINGTKSDGSLYLREFGNLNVKDDRTHIHIVSGEDAI